MFGPKKTEGKTGGVVNAQNLSSKSKLVNDKNLKKQTKVSYNK